MKLKLISAVVTVLAALVLNPGSAAMAAGEQPETVSLYDIRLYTGLITSGDYLAYIPYNLAFDTEPSAGIDETYIFRWMTATGTELGRNTASPLFNDGYGHGVVSFYLASGVTENTSYTFRVQQNPAYYPDPEYWDFEINASNYEDASDQSAALKAQVVDTCDILSPEFGVSLLTTTETGSTVLSLYGELYFLEAVPGLQTMCNELFSVQLENPDFTDRDWSTALADAMRTKYAGTFIGDFMTGFAGLFSLETSPAMNSLAIGVFVIVIILSIWKGKATILAATLDGYCALLLLMLMGFFSMIWAGFMAFVFGAILGGGVVLFKRS